jgi:hypothetical protein
MTSVRLVVSSPLGDVDVEVEADDFHLEGDERRRGRIDTLTKDAVRKIKGAYEIAMTP